MRSIGAAKIDGAKALRAVCLAFLLLVGGSAGAQSAGRIKLVAGPERGVDVQLARDLAKLVGPEAGVQMAVLPTAGTVDTLLRLRDEGGAKLALVSSDIVAAYAEAAERGFPEAAQLVAPLRVMASLYPKFFHFIVRSDSDYASFADLRDARINLGPANGNTALSVANLHRLFFDEAIATDKASFLNHEEALARLITDRSLDVVAIVAEQPAKLLADMKPEARRYIKVLDLGPLPAATGAAVARVYRADRLRAASYPNLFDDDIDALSIRTLLVAYEHRHAEFDAQFAAFSRAFCRNLPRLKSDRQAVWRRVEVELPDLGPGWHYASPRVRREMASCAVGVPAALPTQVCTAAYRAMALCE